MERKSYTAWPRQSSRCALLESLEHRRLMALATWVGAAGDNLWSSPDNWSQGAVPVNGDDVVLDAGVSNPIVRFTAEVGSVQLNSLVTHEALMLTGGALWVRTAATLRASLTISGGTLGGGDGQSATKGIWDSTAGPIFIITGGSSRIEGNIKIVGSLTVTSANVRVAGNFELSGLVTVNNGGIDFENEATTLTSGFFVLNNGRLGMASAAGDVIGTSKSLTLGTSVSVRGWGSVGGSLLSQGLQTSFINNGTITADSPSHWLMIAPLGAFESRFTNNSIVRATGGGLARISAVMFTNYSDDGGGTLIGGTWRVDAQSTLSIDYNRAVAVNQAFITLGGTNAQFPNLVEQLRVNQGSITLGNGMIWSLYLGFSNRGTITLETISNLNLPVGGTHTGTFVVGAQSVLTLNSGAIMGAGALLGGAGTVIYSSGNISLGNYFTPGNTLKLLIQSRANVTLTQDISLGMIENAGTFNVGLHRVMLAGNQGNSYLQTSAGTTILDIMGGGRMGAIVGAAAVMFGGTLRIISSNGFDPSENVETNFTAVMFTGSAVTGSFGNIQSISATYGSYLLVNTGTSFELWHNIADYNNDGGVDGADIEAFIAAWSSGNNGGDVNGDGGVDGADFESFFAVWSVGGR